MLDVSVNQTHCGQYKPYGDSFYVWHIRTDSDDNEAVLDYCFEHLHKRKVPHSDDWHRNIRHGGEKSGDANYYFAGYYNLEKIDVGYKFTICEPFTD